MFDPTEIFYDAVWIQDNEVKHLSYTKDEDTIYFDAPKGINQF